VQIIAGAYDTAVPPVNAEFLEQPLPERKLDIIDAGHSTWEDAADEYGSLVTSPSKTAKLWPVTLVSVGSENRVLDCEYRGTVESLAQVRFGTGPVVFVVRCTLRRCRFALDADATQLPGDSSQS
jgi:hypothetical protein